MDKGGYGATRHRPAGRHGTMDYAVNGAHATFLMFTVWAGVAVSDMLRVSPGLVSESNSCALQKDVCNVPEAAR